jgi:hypothetical protein
VPCPRLSWACFFGSLRNTWRPLSLPKRCLRSFGAPPAVIPSAESLPCEGSGNPSLRSRRTPSPNTLPGDGRAQKITVRATLFKADAGLFPPWECARYFGSRRSPALTPRDDCIFGRFRRSTLVNFAGHVTFLVGCPTAETSLSSVMPRHNAHHLNLPISPSCTKLSSAVLSRWLSSSTLTITPILRVPGKGDWLRRNIRFRIAT